jgi:hypothetical protein
MPLAQRRFTGCHAGHIAVVFAGLVGGAHYHILYRVFVEARVAPQELAQYEGGQVVWANAAERTAKFSNRGAHGIHDIRIRHSEGIIGAKRVRRLRANFGLATRTGAGLLHNRKDDTKNPKRFPFAAGFIDA